MILLPFLGLTLVLPTFGVLVCCFLYEDGAETADLDASAIAVKRHCLWAFLFFFSLQDMEGKCSKDGNRASDEDRDLCVAKKP